MPRSGTLSLPRLRKISINKSTTMVQKSTLCHLWTNRSEFPRLLADRKQTRLESLASGPSVITSMSNANGISGTRWRVHSLEYIRMLISRETSAGSLALGIVPRQAMEMIEHDVLSRCCLLSSSAGTLWKCERRVLPEMGVQSQWGNSLSRESNCKWKFFHEAG